jgi:hypothetical protein
MSGGEIVNFIREGWLLPCVLYAYLAVEILFFLIFKFYMVPKANIRTQAQPYRDYGNDRHKLLERVLNRLTLICKKTGRCPQKEAQKFLHNWFRPISSTDEVVTSSPSRPFSAPLPLESMSSTASDNDTDSVSSVEDDEDSIMRCSKQGISFPEMTVENIGKDEVDEFLAWSLFEKEPGDMVEWEKDELEVCHLLLRQKLNLAFERGRLNIMRPRRLSKEDVDTLHRPLVIYLFVALFKAFASLLLLAFGFQKIVSKTGVVAWFRPARHQDAEKLMPLLFFHGVAPGGASMYLPFALGLVTDGRATFLFENPNISCTIGFRALTEVEYVEGIVEIVNRSVGVGKNLSIVGHSFGSVPLTWMIRSSELKDRVHQLVLLDPVTIMLSEPDVMVSFLYKTGISLIRMVAGSELFTIYYLRRHFAWYNSELWLEDIPEHTQTIVALSQQDEIVNAEKVREYVELGFSGKLDLLFWKGASHGKCVYTPSKWRELMQVMKRQESSIVKNMDQSEDFGSFLDCYSQLED